MRRVLFWLTFGCLSGYIPPTSMPWTTWATSWRRGMSWWRRSSCCPKLSLSSRWSTRNLKEYITQKLYLLCRSLRSKKLTKLLILGAKHCQLNHFVLCTCTCMWLACTELPLDFWLGRGPTHSLATPTDLMWSISVVNEMLMHDTVARKCLFSNVWAALVTYPFCRCFEKIAASWMKFAGHSRH